MQEKYGKIIANVELEARVENPDNLELIKEFEGTYPLKKFFDERYVIFLKRKPKKGVPTIKAQVDDSIENIRYCKNIKTAVEREAMFPHSIIREWEELPRGLARSLEKHEDLGIYRDTCLYFSPLDALNWGQIEKLIGIDPTKKPKKFHKIKRR